MENETNVENQTTTTESSAAAVPSVESKSSSKIVFLVLGIFFLCVLAAGVIGAFIYVRSTEVKELNENTAKEFLEEFTELNVEDESYRLTMNLGRGQEVISEFDSENGILHSKYSSERVEEELEYYVDSKNNVVYSLGFANSRREARQLVGHNHILLNGKRANIASLCVILSYVYFIFIDVLARGMQLLFSCQGDRRWPALMTLINRSVPSNG